MRTTCRLMISFLLVFSLLGLAVAQDNRAANAQRASEPLTAFASSERVRFTAASSVVQMHLEVYSQTGLKLFDFELKGGNVLDWHHQNGQAERISPGSFLCVVTVKNLSGKLTQKIGTINVSAQQVTIEPVQTSGLSTQQAQAIGPLEEDSSLTVLKDDDPATTAVIAHNGEEAQISRGNGALSFRLGDFLRGKDQEQMRLTPEGNLGIGITHPQARLDVDGLIRTSQGILFPDGSIQTTAAIASSSGRTPDGTLQPEQISTSQTSSGKAGKNKKNFSPDLFVNEDLTVNGNIIFTPPSPQFTRDITMQNNNGGLRFYGAPTLTSSPAAAAIQFWGNNSPLPGQLYLDSGAHDSGAVIIRSTGTGGTIAERMRVTAAGNVGIGTNNPQAGLEINRFPNLRLRDPFTPGSLFEVRVNGGVLEVNGGPVSFGQSIGIGTATPDRNLTLQSSGGTYLNVKADDGTHEVLLGADSAGGILSTMTNHDLQLRAGGNSTKMTIKANGKVLIGATENTCDNLLHVIRGNSSCFFDAAILGENSGSDTSVGVGGTNTTGSAVAGISATGPGVHGTSASGIGVLAISINGTAVVARSHFGSNLFEGFDFGDANHDRRFAVERGGRVLADGNYTGPADFAEMMAPSGSKEDYEPGDVLAIGPDGRLVKSTTRYSSNLAGVYSTKPGFVGDTEIAQSGLSGYQNGRKDARIPLALLGIVPTKVSAENGTVRPGDLLTTSRTPGHAMRARRSQSDASSSIVAARSWAGL